MLDKIRIVCYSNIMNHLHIDQAGDAFERLGARPEIAEEVLSALGSNASGAEVAVPTDGAPYDIAFAKDENDQTEGASVQEHRIPTATLKTTVAAPDRRLVEQALAERLAQRDGSVNDR